MSYQTRPWLPPHLAPVENTIREKSWRARCAASSQHRARTHARHHGAVSRRLMLNHRAAATPRLQRSIAMQTSNNPSSEMLCLVSKMSHSI